MFSGPAGGLWVAPNPWSSVPDGSLRVGTNLVFTASGVLGPRRGFSYFFTTGELTDALAYYGTTLLASYDLTRAGMKPLAGSFFAWAETFTPFGDNRLRFEMAAKCAYFNPVDGIRVFDGGHSAISTADIDDAGYQALRYDSGTGDIQDGTEVSGAPSGITGQVANDYLVGQSSTAGVLPFVTADGTFLDGDVLTGDGSWAGVAVGDSFQALLASNIDNDVDWTGYRIAGSTSGATATVAVVLLNGLNDGTAVLGLSSVVGTFVTESIALSTSNLEPTMAGCPQGLNILTTASLATAGFLAIDSAVAYRFTICRKDEFGRIIEGPPSGRTTLHNTAQPILVGDLVRSSNVVTGQFLTQTDPGWAAGDTVDLSPGEADFAAGLKTLTYAFWDPDQDLEVFIYNEAGADAANAIEQEISATHNAEVSLYFPDDCTTAHFLRVYRSEGTLAATDTPSDEMFQVYESPYLSLAELAAGFISFTDTTPESVLENPLYTNANTGDGTLSANYRPPAALDLAYWQNRMWYLNTKSKYSANLALIGCGSPDGLQDGDELTLTDLDSTASSVVTFTAKTTPSGDNEFKLYSDGDPGYNIERTAQALCQKINNHPSPGNLIPYAFYVSSDTGLPGKIYLQARLFGDTHGINVYSSRPTAWTPQLPVATVSGSVVTSPWPPLISDDDRHEARLWYSKLGQPEAVPLLNNLQVNADNEPAKRVMALNFKLLVFKSDGLYYVPDSFPPSLQKLSDDVIIAPDSAAKLEESVYFLSDRGLLRVDDSGVVEVSIPIDTILSELGGTATIDDLRTKTFGMAYRSAQQYILWVIDRDGIGFTDINAQAFVFSTKVRQFTRYDFGARAACIEPLTDSMVVADAASTQVWKERKTLTDADYVDADNGAIGVELIFNDFTAQMPAVVKTMQQCSFLFRSNSVETIVTSFASDEHPGRIEVELETEGFGDAPWGETPWGGFVRTIRRIQPMPVEVTSCAQLSVGFAASVLRRKFEFLGIDIVSNAETVTNRG